MKKIILFLLLILTCVPYMSGCGEKEPEQKAKLLSFSQAQSVEEMFNYDGEIVVIIGYMSTLSPINGEFMYLMNLPYQSCPFCVPNTTQLANTMAVYAKSGKEFDYTTQAIKVTGMLEFGDFTDEFGYVYNYRICDATYEIVNTEDMDPKIKLWQQLATTDVISEVYNMYEYVNFLCYWPYYYVRFESGTDYLYALDAINYIETEGAQYNYGFKEGYFEEIVMTILEVNETEFKVLVDNVLKAKALSEKAYNELKVGNYTVVKEYGGVFNDGRNQYKVNIGEELEKEMDSIYKEFSDWLSSWEL